MSSLVAPAEPVVAADHTVVLDANGIYYRELNRQLLALVDAGAQDILLTNVVGQRYIGTNLQRQANITIEGVPGADLGAFMDGPRIVVHNNAQDACGNTMNSGRLVVHGSVGDIAGHSMRGGKLFVRDNAGYRIGIHMKEYGEIKPVVVIGGTAQHFLGEYMAGGILIVLGLQLDEGEAHPSHYLGTGMHGGVIYMRGRVEEQFMGKEVGSVPLSPEDKLVLSQQVGEFCQCFGFDPIPILEGSFTKLISKTRRPYGRLYAY
jgi:glutamate synthase domain-containing protein 3